MNENLNIYPKKLGMRMPLCSAMDLTMKLGPLPMYVMAPKNTAPSDMAASSISGTSATYSTPSTCGRPVATVWKARAVGRQCSRAVVELPRMCQPECCGVGVEVYKGGGHGGEDADEEYGDLDYGLP